jgi:hypothetical protein
MEDVEIFYGHLVYFTAIWSILRPFGIFYGHLVYFMVIWYILWSFGIFNSHLVNIRCIFCMLYQEKSLVKSRSDVIAYGKYVQKQMFTLMSLLDHCVARLLLSNFGLSKTSVMSRSPYSVRR